MAAVSQTTLSNAFSWIKMLEFRLRNGPQMGPMLAPWTLLSGMTSGYLNCGSDFMSKHFFTIHNAGSHFAESMWGQPGTVFCLSLGGVGWVGGGGGGWGVGFKNTYELLNLRALKFSTVNKIYIFQYMGNIFCVEFQRVPLKFHTNYLTHTLKDTIFIQSWNF